MTDNRTPDVEMDKEEAEKDGTLSDDEMDHSRERCVACAITDHCNRTYDGCTTRYCVACAKTHDQEWYAAYVAATRCEQCREHKFTTATYDGRATRCCIGCAKTHDKEWHAAYVGATRCEHCRDD